jgi:hypothetical protein
MMNDMMGEEDYGEENEYGDYGDEVPAVKGSKKKVPEEEVDFM